DGITVASTHETTAAMRDTETDAGPVTLASDDGDPSSTGEPVDPSSTGEPVDPDLLVWLSFDDAAAPFADASGNARDGACEAPQCPTSLPTDSGGMLHFDGIDDRLSIANDEALQAPSALTLAAWIEVDALALPTYQDVIAKTYGDSNSNSWGIGFPNDSTALRMVMHDGTAVLTIGTIEWPGGAHHVAGTWDGALARLYLDGVSIGEVELAAIAADTHAVLIGADVNAELEGNYFGGTLDDLRIYQRALAEDEILALAAR
ncbi:MAG: LamG domain-containing protein, partial [Deltaproteobacteria bacterium]|nr:LamG domain-containing protein [Nannocystaceae bacterium]